MNRRDLMKLLTILLCALLGRKAEARPVETETGFMWRGPWTKGSHYRVNDVVMIWGDVYVAVADSQRSTPKRSDWAVLALPAVVDRPQGPPRMFVNCTFASSQFGVDA